MTQQHRDPKPFTITIGALDEDLVVVVAREPDPSNPLGSVGLYDCNNEPFLGLPPDQARQLAAHLIAAAERVEPYQRSADVRPLRAGKAPRRVSR